MDECEHGVTRSGSVLCATYDAREIYLVRAYAGLGNPIASLFMASQADHNILKRVYAANYRPYKMRETRKFHKIRETWKSHLNRFVVALNDDAEKRLNPERWIEKNCE